MIGSQSLTFRRKNRYLYTGTASASPRTPTAQPPTGGCYVRIEGATLSGSVIVSGTSGGSSTTETISSFDSEGVGFGTKLWTAIVSFTITGFTGLTLAIYPATSTGDKIKLTSYSTVAILCDHYVVNETQFKGYFELSAGETYRSYRQVDYDGRYTLEIGDETTINNKNFTVASIDSRANDIYSAFLTIKRL